MAWNIPEKPYMAKTKSPESALLEVTLKSVDKLGIAKTVTVLENAITTQGSESNDVVIFILEIVCKEFKVAKDELLFGKSRRKRSPAIASASFLLSQHSNLNQRAVAEVLHKKQGAISKHNTFIENLRETTPYEKELLQKISFLNEKIKVFKENKKKSNTKKIK